MSSYPATSADDTQPAATAVSGKGRAPTSVHIRMYRALAPDTSAEDKSYKGLLGDCFLIRLEAGDTKSHILIDCGLLLGSPNAAPRAKQIAEDIANTCSRCLDLLVVTHEHWDHISGFSQASEIFFDVEKLRIKNLWMAWTEDPNDPDAQGLRAKFDKSGQAFAMIAEKLKNTPIVGLDAARALNGLEGFLGVAGKEDRNGKGRRLVGRDILDRLKKQAITQPPSYLAPVKPDRNARPDNVLKTPGAVTLTAYVLGPPRDWKWLSKDKPSTDPAKQETYLETPSLGNALLGYADGDDVLELAESPFAPQYCRRKLKDFTISSSGHAPPDDDDSKWLRERYFQPDLLTEGFDAFSFSEEEKAAAVKVRQAIADRRRIDGEWLASAGALALKLDSDTNNTSLVLAFDLPDGTAMLFAADAQVGNWLSWHEQDYVNEQGTKCSAKSILERVRFYKVGHHGSHNATLAEKGLAMMKCKDIDIVAAIPTDEELGAKQGRGGWQMPNPRVKAALLELTKGRILRNDRWYKDPKKSKDDFEIKDEEIKKDFLGKIKESDLYLEYQIY